MADTTALLVSSVDALSATASDSGSSTYGSSTVPDRLVAVGLHVHPAASVTRIRKNGADHRIFRTRPSAAPTRPGASFRSESLGETERCVYRPAIGIPGVIVMHRLFCLRLVLGLVLGLGVFGCSSSDGGGSGGTAGSGGSPGAGGDGGMGGEAGMGGDSGNVEGWPPTATVYFDEFGVMAADCQTDADCYKVLGYYHAAERFVQMDFYRRNTTGRLTPILNKVVAESFGVAQVDADTRQLYSTIDRRAARRGLAREDDTGGPGDLRSLLGWRQPVDTRRAERRERGEVPA